MAVRARVAIAELVRHSVADEQYLYPAIREHLAAACPDDQLGRDVEQAKKTHLPAPTPVHRTSRR